MNKILQIPSNSYCNNNCIFCVEPIVVRRVNLDKEHVLEILRKSRKELDEVMFVTKEPTLNPLLIEYVKYAKKENYNKIGICSNGRRLSYLPYCLKLVRAGLNKFIISIHGHTAKLHEALTRTPGSFTQTVKCLRNLSSLKNIFSIELNTSTVLTKINHYYIGDIIKFLSGFDIDTIIMNVAQPRGSKMERSFHTLMPNYSDIADEFEKLYDKTGLSSIKNQIHKPWIKFQAIPPCIGSKKIRKFFSCTTGVGIALPSGEIDNIKSFFEGECHNLKREECKECELFNSCEGVPKIYIDHFGWREFKAVKNK